MLITTLAPLLARTALRLDLRAAGEGQVTLTVIPQKAEGAKRDDAEMRPISITATPQDIDAELAKGEAGALAQIVAARKSLGDQIAEQIAAEQKAVEDNRKKAAEKVASKSKPVPPAPPKVKPASKPEAAAPASAPDGEKSADDWPSADSDEPASLWD